MKITKEFEVEDLANLLGVPGGKVRQTQLLRYDYYMAFLVELPDDAPVPDGWERYDHEATLEQAKDAIEQAVKSKVAEVKARRGE